MKSLAYVDAEIGAFYDRLLEAGELEDTVLAVFGDHDSGITLPLADYIGYSLADFLLICFRPCARIWSVLISRNGFNRFLKF